MAIAKAQPTFVQKVVAAVRRDPQKAGILTVLVAILVVLQVRLLTSSKTGPSPATASMTETTPDKPQGAVSAQAEGGNPLRAWLDQKVPPVDRNLFVVNLEKFPQDSGHIASSAPKTALFWDDVAKSLSLQADVRKERQVLIENLAQQAGQIHLQSTMMGAVPKAVINGDLVGEGSVVACGTGESRVTFRVLKIEARRIIIEREGIKLEIQMK